MKHAIAAGESVYRLDVKSVEVQNAKQEAKQEAKQDCLVIGSVIL